MYFDHTLLYWFFHSAPLSLQQVQLCNSHYVICCDHHSVWCLSVLIGLQYRLTYYMDFPCFGSGMRDQFVRDPQLLMDSLHMVCVMPMWGIDLWVIRLFLSMNVWWIFAMLNGVTNLVRNCGPSKTYPQSYLCCPWFQVKARELWILWVSALIGGSSVQQINPLIDSRIKWNKVIRHSSS